MPVVRVYTTPFRNYIQHYNKPESYKLPSSQEYSTSNAFQQHSQRIEFKKLSDFPRIGEDQHPEHERAFVPIADHARSPSDASSVAETIHSEDTIEVECYNNRYSTCSSPELPLPPQPVTERMEDLDDVPLPPPPAPAELDIQHRPMSPIHMAQQFYHKKSYLSSKPISRAGFGGIYHRSGICSPPAVESPTFDHPPPCIRKPKTKITKVGKSGATVIFSSDTLERPTHVNIANNEEIEHTSVSAQIANFEKVAGKPPISNGTVRSESCYYPSYSRSRSSGALPDIRDYGRSYRRARSDKIPDVVVSDESGQSTGTDSPRSVSSPPPTENRLYASRSTPSIHDLDRTSPTMQTSKIKPEIKLKLYTNRRMESDLTKSPTENGYLSPPICDSDGRLCLLRSRSESPLPRSPSPSQHIEDERHLQELTDQVASSTHDRRLSSLLRRDPRHKTMSDYITGLFDTDVQPRDKDIKPGKLKTKSKSFSAGEKKLLPSSQPPMSVLSAYLSTSEPKAKLMTRINSERHLQEADKTIDSTELVKKKEELISSISNKLKILLEEQEAIKVEIAANEELGAEVTKCVEKVAKQGEFEKYKMHVDELEKIMNLLLGLSGRLARAENVLSNLPDDADTEEKMALLEKRDKLSSQYEDALKLKEAIDRRSRSVSELLQRYLTHDEYEDYEHFVKIKSKMIIDTREVDDKLKLGEEQLAALINSR